jgi:hypothetical protein
MLAPGPVREFALKKKKRKDVFPLFDLLLKRRNRSISGLKYELELFHMKRITHIQKFKLAHIIL